MSENNKVSKAVLKDLKAANLKTQKFLDDINSKIALLDIKYVEMKIKEDVNTVKIAKKILEKNSKK